ncbi:hypothetical protein HZH68_009071 [Vespula germanica]|uniref:Beta-1,4-glucuronyltransferase 1 n=1 Tax=Vespula germanica TaxID=30212 RepID=A0A834N7L5_VESGE|nr:hypothetical protein HZH68_009071 [Vespula germanica]
MIWKLRCQPWNLSLTSVIVLALSNMLLTFLLLQSETCTQNSIGRELEINAATDWNLGTLLKEQQEECATRDYRHTTVDRLNLDVRLGRWDARRLFKTFDSIFVGSRFSELSQTYRVCLATQSSIEKLYSIVEVAHQWTGSMSVALYAAGDEEFEVLQKYLLYLKKCYEPVRERISFSLAVPRVKPLKKQPRTFALPDIVDCAKPEATLNELMSGISVEQTNWRTRNVYPQNHLRNLARKNCQSDYVFLTDVDIVPSLNLTSALDDFLRNENCDKCAYVIPTYELDSRVRFPSNKSDLVRLARKGLARPFHQKMGVRRVTNSQELREHKKRQDLRESRSDKFRIPLRTVLRGKGYCASSRRKIHGIWIYEKYSVYRIYLESIEIAIERTIKLVHVNCITRKLAHSRSYVRLRAALELARAGVSREIGNGTRVETNAHTMVVWGMQQTRTSEPLAH